METLKGAGMIIGVILALVIPIIAIQELAASLGAKGTVLDIVNVATVAGIYWALYSLAKR